MPPQESQTPNNGMPSTEPTAQPAPQPQFVPGSQPQSVNVPLPQGHEVQHTPDQGRSKLSSVGKRCFHLIEFDSNEELLLEIRKHLAGILIMGIISALVSVAAISITFVLASSTVLTDIGMDGARKYIALLGFIITIGVVLMTAVYIHLFLNDVVFVTNEKLAQVLYVTILSRKVSQLNIGDVQDVNVDQRGLLARLFNYGTLTIETAGEQNNYVFTYVPDPFHASRTIIAAHEASIHKYGN